MAAAGAATALAVIATVAPTATASAAPSTPFIGYEVLMQDSTHRLVAQSPVSGIISTNFFLDPASSPAIADLGQGAVEIAFVDQNHVLWRGSPETNAFAAGFEVGSTLTVQPGTSPAVASDGDGGWEIAFHGSDGALWTISTGNKIIKSQALMAAGSSPSIAYSPGNHAYEIAFAGPDDLLWRAFPDANHAFRANGTRAVTEGTSPAVATDQNSGFKIAIHNANGRLTTVDSNGSVVDTNATLGNGTSPALVFLPHFGGYEFAFTGPDSRLWRAFPETNFFTFDNGLPMAPGTSPTVATDGDADFKFAFHHQNGEMWVADSFQAGGSGIALAPGTNPAIIGRFAAPQPPPTTFRSTGPTIRP